MATEIIKYRNVVKAFVNQSISIEEFEREYNHIFYKDSGGQTEKVFSILNKLFSDIECYDPECLAGQETAFDISEQELRRCAAEALAKLDSLLKG